MSANFQKKLLELNLASIDYPELGLLTDRNPEMVHKVDCDRQALTPVEEEGMRFVQTVSATTQTRCLSPSTWLKILDSPSSPKRFLPKTSTRMELCLICTLAISFVLITILVSLFVVVGIFLGVHHHQTNQMEAMENVAITTHSPFIRSKATTTSGIKDWLANDQRSFDPILEEEISKNEVRSGFSIDQKMRRKINSINEAFLKRFPRDGSVPRRRYVPRRRKSSGIAHYLGDDPSTALTDREKVGEIMYSLDEDEDGQAGPWELHDWMLWVETIFQKQVVEEHWANLMGHGTNETSSITWSEYQSKVNPHGLRTLKAMRLAEREKRRWKHADNNGDDRMDVKEFKVFLFPQILTGTRNTASVILVPEAYEDLDVDYDGRVSEAEFVDAHHSSEEEAKLERENRFEAKYFREVLDVDKNGYLSMDELADWVEPEGFIQIKSEVVYLMHQLDRDGNKKISMHEIMKDPKMLLTSQVTHFGHIYSVKTLREKVFLLPSNSELNRSEV